MNLTFYKLIFLINLLRCQWSPLKYLEPFLCEKGRERLLYNLILTQIVIMLVVVHVFSEKVLTRNKSLLLGTSGWPQS